MWASTGAHVSVGIMLCLAMPPFDTRVQGEALAFLMLASTSTRVVAVEKHLFVTCIFVSSTTSQLVPLLYILILEGLGMADALGKSMIPLGLSRTDMHLIIYRIYP